MSTPQRIQLRRTKGWRKPEGAVVVSRPSKWGNPFQVYFCACCKQWDVEDNNGVGYLIDHKYARENPSPTQPKTEAVMDAVRLFHDDITCFGASDVTVDEIRAELAGKDLACWCPLGPCHADVLLEIANRPERPTGGG